MSYDDTWPDETLEARKAAVRKTIHTIPVDQLRQIGESLFPIANDPWAERLRAFLADHAADKFYLAQMPDGAQVVYCRSAEKGFWFLPGTGMGFIQPKGLQALAEIVDQL
jgi:hypothetical protein